MHAQVLRGEIIKSGEQNIQQPVNLKRLLWNAQRVFDKEQGGKVQSSKASYSLKAHFIVTALHVSLLCPLASKSFCLTNSRQGNGTLSG